MKKLIYLFILGIGFTSCSVESLDSTENLVTADASAKIKEANTSSMVFAENVCAGEETVITVNFDQKTNSQGKLLPTNVKVDLWVAGEWQDIYRSNVNGITSISFYYTFDEAKDYTLRYSAEEGPWNADQILSVKDCCKESFTYLDNGNGSYTFTYTAGETLTGAVLSMTFPQAIVEAPQNWFNPGTAVSSPEKTKMDLIKCQTYSWTFQLNSDCSKGGNNTPNLWTDFSVNGDSKKFDLQNIVGSCSR